MQEKILKPKSGIALILPLVAVYIASIIGIVFSAYLLESGHTLLGIVLIIPCGLYALLGWISFLGFKSVGPNEALVLTLFGKYIGSIKQAGFFYVHPLSSVVNPAATTRLGQSRDVTDRAKGDTSVKDKDGNNININIARKQISLKDMTLNNATQKVNDALGTPVEIGIGVIWRVVDTAAAVFNVDNYKEYLSLQCDSAVRNIARVYPYDVAPDIDTTGDGNPDDGSLRGSSTVVAERIRLELQEKVKKAGIEILDTRITNLSYSPEIASVMLQRQQASALIDARMKIVDGAVGMVEMALRRIEQEDMVKLDEERKAQMVSNLLVVLCSNKDSQPVVNTGSLY